MDRGDSGDQIDKDLDGTRCRCTEFGNVQDNNDKIQSISNVDLIIVDSNDFDSSSFSFSLLTFAFNLP